MLSSATVESSVAFPKKITNGIAISPGEPTSGNVPEEPRNTNKKEYMYPDVHSSVYNSKDLERAKVPIGR